VPGGFTLTGRADRIERYADASLAILDYKTGKPPTQGEVQSGLAPQLPLEAAMAAAGAFGPALQGGARALLYWQLSGGFEPGHALLVAEPQALVAATEAGLRRLIAQYDDPATCYLAQPVPEIAPRHGVYAQLARVAEWAGG
jgi:ATP-dependent helicase/nuclease subunit B